MDVFASPPVSSSTVSQPELPAGDDPPADPSAAEKEMRRRLLTRIEEQTSPAPLPKRWSFLRYSRSVRRQSGDASELIAFLKTEFNEAELRAAGVLEQGTGDELQLSSVLGEAASSFVIRRDSERSPTDVVSARGLLSSATPEWLRLAAERADTRNERPEVVLAAFDDNDLLVLHRLGLKYTSAAGLATICGNHVRELFTARARHSEQRKYTLTIPGWQIANAINEPTPLTRRAIAHIAEIPHHYGHDPAAVFRVWLPAAAEFRDICGAMEFADPRLVARALRKSLNHSQYSPADALRVISDRTEISYGVARSQLHRALLASRIAPRAGEVDIALSKFWKAFQKSVVNKFLKFAEGDGWDEWRSMMAAELAEEWFDQLEIVAAARRVLAGEYPAYRETFDDDLFSMQLRMADAFARLYRLKPPVVSLVRKN